MRGRKRSEVNKLAAVAYVRCSTEEQHLGPQAQRESIEKWAKANGVEVVSWHEDLGVSGGLPVEKRPGLLAALNAVKERGAGLLLVAKRDRLARDIVAAGMTERLLENLGAKVASADGVGAGDGPEAFLLKSIVDCFSQYERLLIKFRTRQGLAVKKSRGQRIGSVPYGFSLADDGIHLEPNTLEVRIIQAARTMREQRLSLRAIGERLLEAGMAPRSGGAWNPKSVLALLKSQVLEVA